MANFEGQRTTYSIRSIYFCLFFLFVCLLLLLLLYLKYAKKKKMLKVPLLHIILLDGPSFWSINKCRCLRFFFFFFFFFFLTTSESCQVVSAAQLVSIGLLFFFLSYNTYQCTSCSIKNIKKILIPHMITLTFRHLFSAMATSALLLLDAAHWWWLKRSPPPPHMIVKCFGCTAIHNKALYK